MIRCALAAIWVAWAIAATALAVPVKTQDVKFSSGPETVSAYLAAPEAPGTYPALVVLHEDWGLTDWVKEQTRRLAEEGYVALALDLYHGQVAHDPAYAYDLMAGTQPDHALLDMEAAIHFLATRSDVNKDKVGSIGWSAGGKWSILLAVHDPFLAACVLNYGSLPTDPAAIQKIRAPVLGIFGEDDRNISSSDVDAFEEAMNSAHKSIEVKIYRHAGHGFESSENKLGFREDAAADAWQRTVAFLNQHLK
jgi:carboxymethylenebutenolidase